MLQNAQKAGIEKNRKARNDRAKSRERSKPREPDRWEWPKKIDFLRTARIEFYSNVLNWARVMGMGKKPEGREGAQMEQERQEPPQPIGRMLRMVAQAPAQTYPAPWKAHTHIRWGKVGSIRHSRLNTDKTAFAEGLLLAAFWPDRSYLCSCPDDRTHVAAASAGSGIWELGTGRTGLLLCCEHQRKTT